MKHLDKFNESSKRYNEIIAMTDPIFYDIGSLGATVRVYCPHNSVGKKTNNLNWIYITEVISEGNVENHLEIVNEVITICQRLKDVGKVQLKMQFLDAKFVRENGDRFEREEGGENDTIMYRITLSN